tara:strand:+ start:248 stop:1297 length:1050 start_codon:yes stop_codon:yes gene_type:complete
MANLVRYSDGDIVVSTDNLTTSTWSDNTNNLQTAHTSSLTSYATATSSGQFFIEVFNKATTDTTAQVQYAVAYGNRVGSGSPDFTNDIGSFGIGASRTIYNQYRQLVFGDETQNFTFGKHTPDDIYVINIERARFKHNLKPGTLNLKLQNANVASIGQTAGTITLELTDDSVFSTGSATITNLGRQFNIVSGSNGQAIGNSIAQVANSSSYGLFYPDAGIILLNPDNFGGNLRAAKNSGISTNTDLNHRKLFLAISGAKHFIVDSQEKVTSQYYFTRAKNNEFNYTTNPSFVDNNGDVNIDSFVDNPQTFITTVGLYNDSNDLVAVAKLSQPVTKDFTKEALIRVKLDY